MSYVHCTIHFVLYKGNNLVVYLSQGKKPTLEILICEIFGIWGNIS